MAVRVAPSPRRSESRRRARRPRPTRCARAGRAGAERLPRAAGADATDAARRRRPDARRGSSDAARRGTPTRSADAVAPADRPPPPRPRRAEAPTLPLAAAPDYAFGVRLDPGPRPLERHRAGVSRHVHLREGVVVLRLLISETGARRRGRGRPMPTPRGVFEQAALEAFSQGAVLARAGGGHAGQEPDHGRGPVHADQSRRSGVRPHLLTTPAATGRNCCAAVFFALGGRVGARRGRNREGAGGARAAKWTLASASGLYSPGPRARRLRRRLRRPHQGPARRTRSSSRA